MKKNTARFSFLAMLAAAIIINPFTASYFESFKMAVPAGNMTNSLYDEIAAKSKSYEAAPQNAEIHKIWKATPGYNGLTVDVNASYEKMKKGGKFDDSLLVFKQVPPVIHLKDLPPSPIYRGNPEKPMVSFLINVAWGNEYIPKMLDTLTKYHVKATFFLEGRWVKENPELAKMIADAGQEIGNHSYTHPDMSRLSSDAIRSQIQKTNEVIQAATGKKTVWFGPPSGSFRDEVTKVSRQMNMGMVLWSVDTIDWQKPSPEVLFARVMKKVHNGAMILMHPTDSTEKSLEKLILSIRKKGLMLGTVTSLMSEERIITHPGQETVQDQQ
ncbi:polysaccharide deacetylase family protein [Metabacillus sp. RGM 3146]|uniref:polysaccharide deacetylase family protein n=1 Tax=Metabacillus sp. RGM 3146 TaxID=3401092 RepID=UPI003B9A8EA7